MVFPTAFPNLFLSAHLGNRLPLADVRGGRAIQKVVENKAPVENEVKKKLLGKKDPF